jgi:hypothetical protein
MDKKCTILSTILLLALGISVFWNILLFKRPKISQEIPCPEKEKLEKFNALLESKIVQFSFNVAGMVKEISDHSIFIEVPTKEGKVELFKVPVSKDAKIISKYILPPDAPQEEVKEFIETGKGKRINLGEKEIKFDEIKIGDTISVALKMKPDFSFEGIFVEITPANVWSEATKE